MLTPYEPRPLRFLGLESVAGYCLKTYLIRYGHQSFDRERFAVALEQAGALLPQPAMTDERPGVGFAILHQAQGGDYLILGWWDHENELPIRVFVNGPNGWRPAVAGESFCVWDLRVIWWEREAYVGTMLAGRADMRDAYLAMVFEGYA